MATIYYIDETAVREMTGKSSLDDGWDEFVTTKTLTTYFSKGVKRGDIAVYDATVDFTPDTVYIYDGEMFKELAFVNGMYVIPDEFREDKFPSNYWRIEDVGALDYAWKFSFEDLDEPYFELDLKPIRQQLLSNMKEVVFDEENTMITTSFVSDHVIYTINSSLQFTKAEIRQIIEEEEYMSVSYVPWDDVAEDVDIRTFEMSV